MKTYKIIALPLSSMEIDKAVLMYRFHYGQKIRIPNVVWYIEGADMNILVDTAADAKLAMEFRGLPAKEIMSFEDSLESVGLKPEDIDIVVQTHLQWDHCANTQKCRNAKILVQEEELRFAYSPHPILAPTYKKSLFTGLNFVLVKGAQEILPGIDLVPTPGHTPGNMSVAVNTEEGKAIITGFCCLKENFGPPVGASEEIIESTPVVAPGIHLNAVDGYESVLLVKGMADIVLACHDPAFEKPQVIG
ncbi:MBL fold hydrolase [Desulfosarcina widdelii]|uniref:MBL fold hydrolase n=1 Tax=Desulfosarcina widdelii TaxID=947919 RepID=A0A5K7YX81_9BACT|nr:N-acyl homoserine lactonase family protein [Desulfosarcina widdelii]BBO72649.1 MBL fold hydrolase [Desulfosarcina widdelii]